MAGESGERFAFVEAFLVRHSEGVKKDDGVVVEEGGFAARREVSKACGLRVLRTADDIVRFELEDTRCDVVRLGRDWLIWTPSLVLREDIMSCKLRG